MEAKRREAEEELVANGGVPNQAAAEAAELERKFADLGVEMHEVTPDGHWYVPANSLYAALADQLNVRQSALHKVRVRLPVYVPGPPHRCCALHAVA